MIDDYFGSVMEEQISDIISVTTCIQFLVSAQKLIISVLQLILYWEDDSTILTHGETPKWWMVTSDWCQLYTASKNNASF